MNSDQHNAIEGVLSSLRRLEAMLDMIALGTEAAASMNTVECAIDGAADFSRTISDALHAVISRKIEGAKL